jgi:PKD repeat protein
MKALALVLLLLCLVGTASALTETFYCTQDGRVSRVITGTFTAITTGAGTAYDNTTSPNIRLYADAGSPNYYVNTRYACILDTSTIPDAATITGATFYAKGAATYTTITGTSMVVNEFTPDTSVIQISDYQKKGLAKYSANFSLASWSTSAYNSIPLTNLTFISKTGNSSLMFITHWDAYGEAPGWVSSGSGGVGSFQMNVAGAGSKPYLEVEYTAATSDEMATFDDIYDGTVYRLSSETFSSLRSGVGNGITESSTLWGDIYTTATPPTYGGNYRGAFTVDTSSIGSSSIINNATITAYGSGLYNTLGTPTASWVDFDPANKTKYVAADYNKTTFTRLTDSVSVTSFAEPSTVITWTSFMMEKSWMIDNLPPTFVSSSSTDFAVYGINYTGGAFKPYLSVNYTSAGGAPITDFSSNVTSGTPPLVVQFNDTSTNTPTMWNWTWNKGNATWFDFADNTTEDPVETFTELGEYNISLLSGNAFGDGTPRIKYYYISVVEGGIGFTANFTQGKPDLIVQFNDTSTNEPSAWSWQFDNGTEFSSDQNPVHTFPRGTYPIHLLVTGTPTGWYNDTTIYVGYSPTSHFYMNLTVV